MSIVQAYTEAYRNYLFDESRTMGRADYIAFPRNEAELVEAVRFARDNHVPLTAQGARTGLAGGASPQGSRRRGACTGARVQACIGGRARTQPRRVHGSTGAHGEARSPRPQPSP